MSVETYRADLPELYKSLDVDPATGLAQTEVAKRQVKFGLNIIEDKHKVSPWKIFIEQFQDFLIVILLAAAVVSILLGERTDGILILIIVLAVAIVGFLNEYKAERTIEALRKLVALKAKVRRGGEVVEIDAKDLVPGDLVLLEEGQKVPADLRLLESLSLQADEASLTGESQPIYKNLETINKEVTIGDRLNMVFSGTTITAGKGTGVVTGIGSDTEIGKIATLVGEAKEEDTPLQRKLDKLGTQLGYGILAICAVVFVVIFFLDKESIDYPLAKRLTFAFIAAVALAVAAIPEGLAFVVRISLALGARRMAKRNALIRKLSAVEALGSTDIVCCDKTGTLTRGEMTVREIYTSRVSYQLSGSGYDPKGDITASGKATTKLDDLMPVTRIGLLCNNSVLRDGKVLGDPTEGALKVSAGKASLVEADLLKNYPRVHEVPFSSARKLMSTIHQTSSSYYVATKGAAEVVLDHCKSVWLGGQAVPLTSKLRDEILAMDKAMAAKALRVLAFAYREKLSSIPKDSAIETDLVFAGLQGMMDPPRTEIKETIDRVTNEAGMRVIMITGDHIETAKAVAKEIGIVGEAITGLELDQLSQTEFTEKVETLAIYARVNPEHKIRIVQALKHHGHQVAMTGDGVNDAAAIKAADIGIAMGITGTDVAKEAADVILLDDHFLTIVNAIEEGRGIFDNVRKFVNYLLSCNIAEVLVVLAGIIFFGELVLTAIQLLFINIVTDGFPAIALGSDPAEKGIMKYQPKRFQTEIIDRRLWLEMIGFGIIMTVMVLAQFAFNLNSAGLEHAIAVAFTATVVLELVRLISVRSDYKINWRSNPWLLVAIVVSFVLQLIVNYTPILSKQFDAAGLRLIDWLIILASSLILFVSMKLIRLVLGRQFKQDLQTA